MKPNLRTLQVASGVARAEGDPAAIDRCFRVLSIALRVTAAT